MEQHERKFFVWIAKNHFRIMCFLVPSVVILFISKLPYFNLVIRGSLVYILIAILALYIFEIETKYVVAVSVFTLLLSAMFLLLNLQIPAIGFFDFTFGALLASFIKFVASI